MTESYGMFDPLFPRACVASNRSEKHGAALAQRNIAGKTPAGMLDVPFDDSDCDCRQLSTARLIEHIVTTHHDYLREALPAIHALASKAVRVHARRQPQLDELIPTVRELIVVLLPHLEYEEQKLFPSLIDDSAKRMAAEEFRTMHDEHRAVTRLFKRLHSIANDFRVPDWACSSYGDLIAKLEQLESDLARHTYLETHGIYLRYATE